MSESELFDLLCGLSTIPTCPEVVLSADKSLYGFCLSFFGRLCFPVAIQTGLRLRKSSLVRNHCSPVDFITDRYQSQVLRYTVAGLQVLTSVIYVAAQVNALKSTFNSMFGIDPESPVAVIIMFIIILAFEWAGGLSSVALTDAVQGFIMILSFLMLSGVVKKNFGGWSDLDPVTYPRVSLFYMQRPKVNGLFIAV